MSIKYLKEEFRKDRAGLSPVVPSHRIRDNGHTLKHRRLPMNIRKYLFTLKKTEHWHRLARESVESLPLEIFKSCLGMVLGKWV